MPGMLSFLSFLCFLLFSENSHPSMSSNSITEFFSDHARAVRDHLTREQRISDVTFQATFEDWDESPVYEKVVVLCEIDRCFVNLVKFTNRCFSQFQRLVSQAPFTDLENQLSNDFAKDCYYKLCGALDFDDVRLALDIMRQRQPPGRSEREVCLVLKSIKILLQTVFDRVGLQFSDLFSNLK